jgi:hypothetical protein
MRYLAEDPEMSVQFLTLGKRSRVKVGKNFVLRFCHKPIMGELEPLARASLRLAAIIAQKHQNLILNPLSRLQSRCERNSLQGFLNAPSAARNFLS